MPLPRLLLIDDNKTRIQQFEDILLFMEYQVSTTSSIDYDSLLKDLDDVRAVFIGDGCEKQATLIKTVIEATANLPIILLIEKGTALQIPTPIKKMLTGFHEWPSVLPVFTEILKNYLFQKKLKIHRAGMWLIKDWQGIVKVLNL